MSSAKDKAINKARQLIGLLKTNGFDIYEAYVFGSVAMGKKMNTAILISRLFQKTLPVYLFMM